MKRDELPDELGGFGQGTLCAAGRKSRFASGHLFLADTTHGVMRSKGPLRAVIIHNRWDKRGDQDGERTGW